MKRKKLFISFFPALLAIMGLIFGTVYFLKKKPDLTVAGLVIMGDGLGRLAVEFMDVVCDEMEVNFIPTRHNVCLTDVPSKFHSVITKKPNYNNLGKVLMYYDALPDPTRSMPKFFQKVGPKNPDQIRIAYSMFECSLIPSSWADVLNTYFDAVAVPDEFLEEVYRQSGVQIPIFVLPIGLPLDPFLKQPLKTSSHKPFCFINTSSMSSRKNHYGIVQAFHQAFGDNPDVQLLMNFRYASDDVLMNVKDLIASLNAKNIILKSEKLNNREYLQFLLQGDAFVSLSKGEGFSIQPREAMALGFPVIISDNTSHKTIVKSGLACGVGCPTREVSGKETYNCGEVFVPDVQAAACAMKDIYENYETALKNAQSRRQWAANYQYENLKQYYLNLVKPSKIVLSNNNEVTKDGLITNSPELYQKYIKILKTKKESSLLNNLF